MGFLRKVAACFLVITVFWLLSSPASVAVEYAYVHGIVVDEKGVGLSEVGVQVYTSGGALVATTSTSSDGFFVIWAEFGTYNIYLTKPGYAKAVKSIAVQRSDTDLGTIVLGKALRLSSSTLSLIASPGDKISVPFTVSNTGEGAEVVEFLVSKPQDWPVRVLEQNLEVTKAYVSSGQSLTLQLEVTVPLAALVNVNYNVSLTAIGTTSPSLTFTILVRSQPTATVSGRVIDEYDNGMEEVEIKAYSSDGAFIKSASTPSDGSFTIELPISTTISLYFSKDGYVEVTKSVFLKGEIVELGEIVLLKAVRLYSSVLGLVASPGDRLLLPFVLSNIGEESETVEFLISNPEGWSTRILDQVGRETRNVELSSKASLNFQLEVTVPPTSAGDNNLTLTAVGRTNFTLNLMIKVLPLSESVIFCQFPGKSAAPGDTVGFQVRLKNPLGAEMRFKISLDSIPPDWMASVKSASGEYLTEVTLGSNEFVDLVVEVTPPDTAEIGKEYGLLVKVESYDGNLLDFLSLNIRLQGQLAAATVSGRVVDEDGQGIENATIKVYSSDGAYVESMSTSSDGYLATSLALGSYALDFSKEGYVKVTKNVSLKSGGKVVNLGDIILLRALKIAIIFLEVTIEAGKVIQYPVTIINSGDVDRLLLLSVEPPTDWKVVFKYGALEVSRLYLEAKKSENLVIEATSPSTINLGSYTLPVQIKSENGSIYAEINLKATIVGSYALRLEPSTLLTSVTVGSSMTFTGKITNTGNTSVTSLSLGVDVPGGWDVSITPVRVESLKPLESYTFTVAVKTPTDTVAGDYMITLTGLSDQVKSDEVEVRVTATVPTSWGLIGVGIAAAMVIALVFAFIKFRRR